MSKLCNLALRVGCLSDPTPTNTLYLLVFKPFGTCDARHEHYFVLFVVCFQANPPMEQQQTLECVKNKGEKNNGAAEASSSHEARSPFSFIASLVLLAPGGLTTTAVTGPSSRESMGANVAIFLLPRRRRHGTNHQNLTRNNQRQVCVD
jgi:hypothetical protein